MTDALDNVTPADELSTASASVSAPASGVGDARSERSLILAWLASVGVHIVLFTVMVMLPWIHETMGRPDGPEIAVTDLFDIPAQTKFSMAPLESTLAPNRQLEKPSTHIAPEKQNALRELTEVRQTKLSIVGIGTGGGEFAKYGLHVGSGGAGPKFFGLGGEARAARRIVYVVDRSGSMLGIFDDLRREIKRSIDSLRKSQKYHIIFYSSDPPLESPPGRLVNAIRANKERTFEFVDNTFPQGMTQPIEAMRRAFELKPDLVYFLSDGDIPEAELLKEKLREWNHAERVRIFTIAYISAAGRGLLEDIAREHNGSFRFVSEYELGG